MKPKAVLLIPLPPTKVNILCRMNRLDSFKAVFLLSHFRKEHSYEKDKEVFYRQAKYQPFAPFHQSAQGGTPYEDKRISCIRRSKSAA